MYNGGNQIRFKTSMLHSSLCDYSDAYILVKGFIKVAQETAATSNNANENIIFKNCAPFTYCISRLNNTHIDDAHDIDVVIPMYDLIEYFDNYSKTSGILWQYCRHEPALANNGDVTDFNSNNADINSFKTKEKIAGQTGNNGTKNVETTVPLKYLSNF